MLRKVHALKGLNLRDSDLNRAPEYAQDLRNVEKNAKGELVLRWGYDKVLDDAGIIDLFEYVGAVDSPNRGKLLALKSDGLYLLNGATLDKINSQFSGSFVWTTQTKPVEYNKVIYWNDPSGDVDLWKFDGLGVYRAGCPKPSIGGVTFGGAGSYFFRVLLKFYDPQGNITYSDYESYSGTSTINVTYNPLSTADYDGFYNKRVVIATSQTINAGNLTATVISHTYVAGDYAILGNFGGVDRKPIKIDSVTPTTITFNASDVGADSYTLVFSIGSLQYPFEYRWEVEVYRSTLEFSNYELMFQDTVALTDGGRFFLQGITAPEIRTYSTLDTLNGIQALNSVYDDSLVRVLPPKVKYLTLYGEFLLGAFLLKDNPDFGYASLLGNDTRLEDAFVWSDISTLNNGSSIETFLVNNIRPVGASEDGAISAIHGNDDNIVVHKEKQSYYINGDLITNTLRIRKAMSEQVGAASHRSTKNVEGGHLYTSPKGVYLSVGGSKPLELSDTIQPAFTNNALNMGTLELDKAKSVNDFIGEKIYIYIPITGSNTGLVLAYDYYYKEWFLHDNIPADRGFQDVGISSSDIYFADSTSLYKRNSATKKDVLAKIAGRYLSGWFDLDAPSVKKKFNNFILFSVSPLEWTATIKGFCNWNKTDIAGQGTLDFSSTVNVDDYQILSVNANAVAFEISNGSSGEDMLITGYEVQFEPDQTEPKGDT